jgi:hypothetical protein
MVTARRLLAAAALTWWLVGLVLEVRHSHLT